MAVATVTSKGQVTLPKEIRERLDLRRGDKLSLTVDRKGRLLGLPVRHERPVKLVGMLRHLATDKAPTVAEMDEAVGRYLAEDFERATRR